MWTLDVGAAWWSHGCQPPLTEGLFVHLEILKVIYFFFFVFFFSTVGQTLFVYRNMPAVVNRFEIYIYYQHKQNQSQKKQIILPICNN